MRMTDAERRKRLGQYFSGRGLGRLLAALAQAHNAKSIIDPMVGSGDLLAACLDIDALPELLVGIEIDAKVHGMCSRRLPQADCLLGSAFDPSVIAQLPTKSWDLVIANPPYVRYQSFAEQTNDPDSLPGAMQIRTGLQQSLPLLSALDAEDKRLFDHMAKGYSGLSDLAVPAWILSAGLVKPGGRLALIVSESWLSRDYATIARYLLFRWFDIEFVVEDQHASWFQNAQIKTSLVVAKRVERHSSTLSRPEDASYCHISLAANAASANSPIGQLVLPAKHIEKTFARQARSWLENASHHHTELVRARPMSKKLAYANVIAAASQQKWFTKLGEKSIAPAKSVFMPPAVHDWLGRQHGIPGFETLAAQGVSVGQGLRTGANGFFYADGDQEDDQVRLRFSGPLAGLSALAPLRIAKPVLRRQSDLPEGLVVSAASASGWVLDLRGHALPEDLGPDIAQEPYKPIPTELASIVATAAQLNFGTEKRPRKVWELTAVAPNVRAPTRRTPARHWYMLPNFAPRHQPDVFLPRVNSATPTAYLNQNRSCLIDANFSTMWIGSQSKWTAMALLAFMNSSWAQAVIECSGAVMGGGALKVEATHLRRLPVPVFTETQFRRLSQLGDRLAFASSEHSQQLIVQIDAILIGAIGCDDKGLPELRKIARSAQDQRVRHKKPSNNGKI
jgi:tRNA G10  N-methylase Trm11